MSSAGAAPALAGAVLVGAAAALVGAAPHLVHHFLHRQAFLRLPPDVAVRSAGAQTPVGVEGLPDDVGQGRGGEAHGSPGSPGGGARHLAGGADDSLCRGGHIPGLHGLHGRGIGEDAGQERAGLLGHRVGRDEHDGLRKVVQRGIPGDQHQLRLEDQGHEDQQQPHDDDAAEDPQELDDEGAHPLPGLPAPVQGTHRQHGGRDDIQEEDVEHPGDQGQEDGEGIDEHGDAQDEGDEVVEAGVIDVEIPADDLEGIVVRRIVKGFLPGVVGEAEGVRKAGVPVEEIVVGGVQGTHQEDDAVQGHVRSVGGALLLEALQGPEGGVAAHDAQGVLQGLYHALVIHVPLELIAQVGGVGHLLQHGLPGIALARGVGVVEHPLLLQIDQVGADGVEAVVHIVAAVVGGVHAVVGDGAEGPAHGGVLIVRELHHCRAVQPLGVEKQVVHLAQQHVRRRQGRGEDEVHPQDDEDALERLGEDLPHGHLLFAVDIEQLPDHGGDGEGKAEGDADEGHAPVDVVDGAVVQEDIEEEGGLALVAHLREAAEYLKELRQSVDRPADDLQYGK